MFLDAHAAGLLPERYNSEADLPFSMPGLRLLFISRSLPPSGGVGERLSSRIPIVRSLYSPLKEI